MESLATRLDESASDGSLSDDAIEPTISKDLTGGRGARLDETLNLLSKTSEEDQIHLIEALSSTVGSDSAALQDHQRQLMVLEQQNQRRRLMTMARSNRQEEYEHEYSDGQGDEGDEGNEGDEVDMNRDRYGDNDDMQKKAELSTRDETSGESSRKRPRLSPPAQISVEARVMEGLPPHVDLLYSCKCVSARGERHPIPAFRDAPTPRLQELNARVKRWHFNGTLPVYDLDKYMNDDQDSMGAVVIRTIECSESSILSHQAEGSLKWTESIYLKSPSLKTAIKQIAKCYFQPVEIKEIISYESYKRYRLQPAELFLFHHRRLLLAQVLEAPDSTTRSHVRGLLDYIQFRHGADFAEADDLFARGLVNAKHMLKLFQPNEVVISGTYGQPAAFILQEWPSMDSDGWVSLKCWSVANDGSGFCRRASTLTISPVATGSATITKLAAYPSRFADPLQIELVRTRGRKAWELRKPCHVTYKGWTVGKEQFYPDARFMIDHARFRKMHAFSAEFQLDKPEITYPYDTLPAYLNVNEDISELACLLMPPNIPGFYLNEKEWVNLFVDSVHPVTWNKKAFERLVLPSATKELVRALVAVRTSQRGVKQGLGVAGKRTDITAGKGNGLIMLLHGGPGTGKTLTAESVAEIAEMPLYRVTCGDIGTNARAVETYLNTVLHLGKLWNCVLLLDEADVFLEQRSEADLERNSLVSVFLRILEYYDGILILTSNRIGTFDEAFKSRIQVALHYENLNRSSRKKIWQNFIDMLEEDEEDANLDEIKLHLDDLAEKDLNGRQVRNVLTTARQLAIYKNERLDWQHLQQALSVSASFNDYVKRMQGYTDDQRARDSGLR